MYFCTKLFSPSHLLFPFIAILSIFLLINISLPFYLLLTHATLQLLTLPPPLSSSLSLTESVVTLSGQAKHARHLASGRSCARCHAGATSRRMQSSSPTLFNTSSHTYTNTRIPNANLCLLCACMRIEKRFQVTRPEETVRWPNVARTAAVA